MNTVNDSVDEDVELLCAAYGCDPERAKRLFGRVEVDMGDYRHDRASLLSSLGSAMKFLGADEALKLFEEEDLAKLHEREIFASYMTSERAALLSLARLSDLVSGFRTHMNLRPNINSLVETGLQASSFGASQWLNDKLGNAYPHLLASRVTALRNNTGGFDFTYEWPSERVLPERHMEIALDSTQKQHPVECLSRWLKGVRFQSDRYSYSRHTRSGSVPKSVKSLRLALPLGMTRRDYARLIRLRSDYFAAKLDIVSLLESVLKKRNCSGLWDNVTAMLREKFTAHDVAFLLEMESEYRDIASEQRKDTLLPSSVPDANPGGLRDLLEIVSHCETEIEGQWLSVIECSLADGRVVSKAGLKEGYFAAISAQPRELVDMAVDQVKGALEIHGQARMLNFSKVFEQVNIAFDVEVESKTRTQRENANKLGSWIRQQAQLQAKNLALGGPLLPLEAQRVTGSLEAIGFRVNDEQGAEALILEWYDGGAWQRFTMASKGRAAGVLREMIDKEAFSPDRALHQTRLVGTGRRMRGIPELRPLLKVVVITTTTGVNVKGRYWLKSNPPPGF